jgi:hypothetical protein
MPIVLKHNAMAVWHQDAGTANGMLWSNRRTWMLSDDRRRESCALHVGE